MSAEKPVWPNEFPRVWRGESSGDLFEVFDNAKTQKGSGFFFAESFDHADSYAAAGTNPRSFVLDPGKVMDLRDPYPLVRDPEASAVLRDLTESFDDWTCRASGEPRTVYDYLEAGDLYDYEGTGTGERWNLLFRLCHYAGYDSVVVRDYTDGVRGEDSVVWVVFDPERIHFDDRPLPQERPSRRFGF